jgi:hypothetical protein
LGELKTILAKIEADVLHVPQEAKKILGQDTKLIIGTAAVIAFSAGTSYGDILRSIELIHDDIQLRMSKEESEPSKTRKNQNGTKTHRYSARSP